MGDVGVMRTRSSPVDELMVNTLSIYNSNYSFSVLLKINQRIVNRIIDIVIDCAHFADARIAVGQLRASHAHLRIVDAGEHRRVVVDVHDVHVQQGFGALEHMCANM